MTILRTTIRYAAPPDRVFAMLTDPQFVRARSVARGETDVEVLQCEAAGREFRIVSSRTVAVEVPAFARRVLHPTNRIVQTDIWDEPVADVREGVWRVDTRGVPATMRGTMRLAPDPATGGAGTIETIEGVVTSSVPLVGGRVESFLVGSIEASLAKEQEFAAGWLGAASH